MPADTSNGIVDRYLELGLRLGRHVDGFVDAYYGPPALAGRVEAEPLRPPGRAGRRRRRAWSPTSTPARARAPATTRVDAGRRRWIRAQVLGLRTSARKLAGEPIAYLDEVEQCYGARPALVPEDTFAAAHARLDAVLPGAGPLRERYIAWREAHAVPPEQLEPAIRSLADDLRERTQRLFGLPEGEHVDWVFETDKPWSGFNYYEGGLRSRVAINVDLPVLSLSLGHLVAHEAYPGHHTEHTRKEVGLVRQRRWHEETIFLVGTPQCTLAEGLADLGAEVDVRPAARADRGRAPARRSGCATTPRWRRPWPRPARRCRGCGRTRRSAARRGRAGRRRRRLPRAVGAAAPRPGREGGVVPHRRDLAGLQPLLHRGPAALPGATSTATPTRFERLITEQVLPADLAA